MEWMELIRMVRLPRLPAFNSGCIPNADAPTSTQAQLHDRADLLETHMLPELDTVPFAPSDVFFIWHH